jgi:hypothetical protein
MISKNKLLFKKLIIFYLMFIFIKLIIIKEIIKLVFIDIKMNFIIFLKEKFISVLGI